MKIVLAVPAEIAAECPRPALDAAERGATSRQSRPAAERPQSTRDAATSTLDQQEGRAVRRGLRLSEESKKALGQVIQTLTRPRSSRRSRPLPLDPTDCPPVRSRATPPGVALASLDRQLFGVAAAVAAHRTQ